MRNELCVRFLEVIGSYLNDSTSLDVVKRACAYADFCHQGHMRKEGVPYLEHSISVAKILAGWHAPVVVLVAGVLHDVLNPSCSNMPDVDTLRERFGADVANLVQESATLADFSSQLAVSQLDENDDESFEVIAAAFPVILKALQRAPFALVLRIANQIDNGRSWLALDRDTQKAFALVSLRILVPFAQRLGMGQAQSILEDTAFQILFPEEFVATAAYLTEAQRKGSTDEAVAALRSRLLNKLPDAVVTREPVSRFSIFRSRSELGSEYPQTIAEPLLILVDERDDCYSALGIVHGMWPPRTIGFRDYIANPRPNGLRAILTEVRLDQGLVARINIRSRSMQIVAEYGITAAWQNIEGDLLPHMPEVKDVTDHQIGVFVDYGHVYYLVENATPIDLAFKIHSDLGYQCRGALIDHLEQPLTTPLRQNNRVHIIRSMSRIGPDPGWLHLQKPIERDAKSEHIMESPRLIARWKKDITY